jgi:hypothetical protein
MGAGNTHSYRQQKVVFRQGKALRKNTGANGEDDFFANRKAPALPCR